MSTPQMFSNAFDLFPEMFIVTNENFCILNVNKNVRETLDISDNDFLNKAINKVILLQEIDILKRIKSLNTKETIQFEDILQIKKDREYRVNVKVKPFMEGKKKYFSWTFTDFTDELNKTQEMIDFMAELSAAKSKLLEYTNEIQVFRNLVNNMNQGFIISNSVGKITFINNFAKKIFYFDDKDLTTNNILQHFSHTENIPVNEIEKRAKLGPVRDQIMILDQNYENESRFYLNIFTVPGIKIKDAPSFVWNFVELKEESEMRQKFIDFSAELTKMNRELNKKNEEILNISRIDALTRLYTRGYIIELFEIELEKACKENKIFSIIIFDIDNFKSFNDNYGHLFGDMVLVVIAAIAQETVDDFGAVGRYGGEEFLVIMPDRDIDEAVEKAEKIRKNIENGVCNHEKVKIKVTGTFGVTPYMNGDSIDDMIKRADLALYQGKSSGKNKVVKG